MWTSYNAPSILEAFTLNEGEDVSDSVVSHPCDPMDCIPPGSSVHGILQARILEWVALSFSRGSSRPRDQIQVSCTPEILYWLSHQGSPLLNSPLFFLLWNTPKMMPWHSIHIRESPSSKDHLSLLSASLEKKKKKDLFIYFWLHCGLCCCTQTFSTCSEWA